MKKTVLIAITIALGMLAVKIFSYEKVEPLPNWIDPLRETPDGKPPVITSRVAPPDDFRIPAEYENIHSVVLGWSGFTSVLKDIARYSTEFTDVEIWVADGPFSIGIPDQQYSAIDCPLDTVWIRDYGPVGISLENAEYGIIDSIYRHYQYRRHDDAIPTCIAQDRGIKSFGMDLILDGGNIMFDSFGNLFMTKRTYLWNRDRDPEDVDEILMEYFNVKKIHALDYAGYPNFPADGTGHIDMFAKLLSDNIVLISTAETEPFKSTGEKAIRYFESLTAPDGSPYKIITVEGWSISRTWYTYTNSLIVNDLVLIPIYSSYPGRNSEAIAAYQEGIPDATVKGINSDTIIHSGGSIHCVTQTIPALPVKEE